MPVSALVLTLELDRIDEVVAQLATEPHVTLGELQRDRLPVVTEADSLEQAEDSVRALEAVPGVRFVDVVSVDFSDVEPSVAFPDTRASDRVAGR